MGLVIVLAILVVRLSKRGFKTNKPHIYLQVIDSLPLAEIKAVCVIEAGKSLLLVGLTTNNISLLKEFSVDELEDVAELQQEENMNPQEDQKFLERLMDNISKKTKNCNKMKLLLPFVLIGLSLVLFAASKPAFAASGTIVPDINITDGSVGIRRTYNFTKDLGIYSSHAGACNIDTHHLLYQNCSGVFLPARRIGHSTNTAKPSINRLSPFANVLHYDPPTWGEINEAAIAPYMEGEISAEEAYRPRPTAGA